MYAMNAMYARDAARGFAFTTARLGCPVRCRRQGIVVKKEDPNRAPTQGNDLREGSKVLSEFASVLHAASSNFARRFFAARRVLVRYTALCNATRVINRIAAAA